MPQIRCHRIKAKKNGHPLLIDPLFMLIDHLILINDIVAKIEIPVQETADGFLDGGNH